MRPALVPILLADPMPWAYKAPNAWDFLKDRARFAGGNKGALANTPGWSFTRASTGYAQTAAGVLVPFASGELRRTDKGILLEGSRVNLCLQSQALATTPWSNTKAGTGATTTATNNYDTAPDGTQTATRVQCNLSGGTTIGDFTWADQVVTISNTTAYAVSVWVKPVSGTPTIYFSASNVNSGAGVTLSAGWQRITLTGTSSSTSTDVRIGLRGGQTPTCSDSADLLIWGAQLEAAAFPSSYIPTTTASATRAADSLSVTGVTGLDYPLSLYAEFERASDTGATEDVFQVYATNNNDRAKIYIETNDRPSAVMTAGGALQGSVSRVITTVVGTTYKVAGRFGANTIQVAQGGLLGTEDTTATAPATPNAISFGQSASGANPCYGYLRRLAIFSRALSDAELQALTT